MSRALLSHNLRLGKRGSQCGFAVGAILYMLALAGIVGGVIFSSNSQVLRSYALTQNALQAKAELQQAKQTLSATSVLGTDGQTVCPPRSVHEIDGNKCTAAPVALVQFADVTGTQQLPTHYADASLSGTPAEVGVFAVGAGLKALDPYGRYYIYCRWENLRSVPAAPALVLMSAGQDGTLQTKCGDSSPQSDDTLAFMTVAEVINRSSLWQADSPNSVSYGALGSQITIDDSGNLATSGNITGSAGDFLTLHVLGISQQDGAAHFGSTLTADASALFQSDVEIYGDTAIGGGIYTNGLINFYQPPEDEDGGGTGIVGNPNGWTRIDPNGQRFIITPSADQVSAGDNILDIEDTDWNHVMELKADGGALFMGNVGIGTNEPSQRLSVFGGLNVDYYAYLSGYRNEFNDYTNLFLGGSLTDNADGSFTVQTDEASNHFAAIRMDNTGGNVGAITFYTGASTGGTTYNLTNTQLANYARMSIVGNKVGIGTTAPVATLDVNGFAKLRKYGSSPASCNASRDGSIALTSQSTLCVCRNGTGWVKSTDGLTGCAW